LPCPQVDEILIGISSTNGNPLLEIRAIRKAYGRRLALDGVDLAVEAGTVLALLGPNGAGKSSLVSIVAGLRRPDSGTVLVCGLDVAREPRARGMIGLAPQDTGVYLPLSVRDNLRFFGGLAGMRGRELRARIDELAGALMLEGLLSRRASDLSGGERRRLHTAIALVHRPRVVLLDEPTTGADVQTRTEILRLVRAIAVEGAAVVYSTHYLQEVEELAPRVAFIDHGRIVAAGALADLVHAHGSSALELTFAGDVPSAARVPGAVVGDHGVRIPTDDPAGLAARLLPRLSVEPGALRAIDIVQPTLESVFLTVTGRRYEGESAA
jgi:ABC-2 type transport system ATP-binding protein